MRKTLDVEAAQRLIEIIRPSAGLGEWVHQGRCAEVGTDLWFPEKGQSDKAAKAICAGCEVREQCLSYAMEADEPHGIWGGLNRAERLRLRRVMERNADVGHHCSLELFKVS